MDKNIKAIIFDFDGVVVDSEPIYEEVAIELFRKLGVEIHSDDWKDFKGLSEDGFYNMTQKKYNLSISKEDFFIEDKKKLKEKFKTDLFYMPGFIEFLGEITPVYETGLVTSSSRELLNWIFVNTPVERNFQHLITAEDIENPKPHPDPFLKMSRDLNINPENMIVIEDSINGVISAKKAGMQTIGFLSSFTKEELSDADYHASNYVEVKNIIDSKF